MKNRGKKGTGGKIYKHKKQTSGKNITRAQTKHRQTLTNIEFHSLNVPIHLLQVRGEVRVTGEVEEAGEGPHLEPPAVVVEALELELPAVLNQLLQDGIESVGVVPVRQLWRDTEGLVS